MSLSFLTEYFQSCCCQACPETPFLLVSPHIRNNRQAVKRRLWRLDSAGAGGCCRRSPQPCLLRCTRCAQVPNHSCAAPSKVQYFDHFYFLKRQQHAIPGLCFHAWIDIHRPRLWLTVLPFAASSGGKDRSDMFNEFLWYSESRLFCITDHFIFT